LQNFQYQNFVNRLASALRHLQLNTEQLHLAKQAHPIFFNDDGVRPLEQLEAVFLSGGRVTGLRLDKQYPLELNGHAGSPLNPWDQA